MTLSMMTLGITTLDAECHSADWSAFLLLCSVSRIISKLGVMF